KELKAAEDEATRSETERDAAQRKATEFAGKSKAAGGTETKTGAAYDAEAQLNQAAAARFEEERLAAQIRLGELKNKIKTTEIDGETKSLALENARTQEAQRDQENVLAFRQRIDALEGKTVDRTREEIDLEVQRATIDLQRAGVSKAMIDEEMQEYREAATA